MSENTQQPPGGQGPRDPWAPPERKVPLDKPPVDTPPVHNQPTVVSMPTPPADAPGSAPGSAPFPGAPGQQNPGFGAPTPPPAPQAAPGSYGYPAYGQQPGQDAGYQGYPGQPGQDGGYPGYPGQDGGYPGYPSQQSAYGYAGWTGAAAPQNGLGTAAMVLGIIACATMLCTWGISGIVLGVLALIFGILGKGKVARGEANNRGQAQAGFVMGIVGTVLGLVILVLLIVFVANAPSSSHSEYDYWDSALTLGASSGR
ncbi:DUF4190 domain-containing protein [Streptomyces sp. NPDC048361]|uniref:DUF4190 domain-containing protein n=1 Tax=Streptomyces sp. NPDC048361 TaxID=3154720 RepID=UPI0034283D2D